MFSFLSMPKGKPRRTGSSADSFERPTHSFSAYADVKIGPIKFYTLRPKGVSTDPS